MTQNREDYVPTPAPRSHGQDRLLTADDLAERWQVKKTQVWRLTREGRIPHVKIGRYPRYKLAAIERWEQASEGGSADE